MRTPLEVRAVTSALTSNAWVGLDYLPRTPSTNAAILATGEVWRAVTTDHQSAGRGRLGRSWVAPPHTSIAVSALLPVPTDPDAMGWAPLLAGLAVRDAITATTDLDAALKWPNDVLVRDDEDRKVSGVLCELHPEGVVVGIGVNVLQSRIELPVPTATSLALCGATVIREELLAVLLDQVANRFDALLRGAAALRAAQTAYRSACATIGERVELHHTTGAADEVTAAGVDVQGRLLVRDTSGEYAVAAADVVHVRKQGAAGA